MTLAYLGELSFGEAMPFAIAINGYIGQVAGIALSKLRADLTGLFAVQATLTIGPPQLVATIAATAKALVQLEAAIGGPTVTLQITTIAALILDIEAQIAAISLQLQIPLGGRIHAYAYDGSATGLSAELAAATASGFPGGHPNDHCDALVLATVEPATWAMLKTMFHTGPL